MFNWPRRSNPENCRNQKLKVFEGKTSTYKGVSLTRKGWAARITAGGTQIHIGKYATEKEAARAYDAAAIRHHGEFAKANFIGKQAIFGQN